MLIADHFAARRHERTAGVAGIERRVGLDDVVHQPAGPRPQRSAQRADHAGGHRVLEAVRVADGDRDLPDAHRVASRRASPTAAIPPAVTTRTTARSVSASCPTTIRPHRSAVRHHHRQRPGRSTTWLLVRISPSGVKQTPEPPPCSDVDLDDGRPHRLDGANHRLRIRVEQVAVVIGFGWSSPSDLTDRSVRAHHPNGGVS